MLVRVLFLLLVMVSVSVLLLAHNRSMAREVGSIHPQLVEER
jgi:hypothetical protein